MCFWQNLLWCEMCVCLFVFFLYMLRSFRVECNITKCIWKCWLLYYIVDRKSGMPEIHSTYKTVGEKYPGDLLQAHPMNTSLSHVARREKWCWWCKSHGNANMHHINTTHIHSTYNVLWSFLSHIIPSQNMWLWMKQSFFQD